jgi:hypothetical protein
MEQVSLTAEVIFDSTLVISFTELEKSQMKPFTCTVESLSPLKKATSS